MSGIKTDAQYLQEAKDAMKKHASELEKIRHTALYAKLVEEVSRYAANKNPKTGAKETAKYSQAVADGICVFSVMLRDRLEKRARWNSILHSGNSAC